jgi:methyl-accepting chemotaxis protein-1 (serine sensor receptor)
MGVTRLTVRARLTVAFGGLAAIAVIVSGLALHALTESNERFASYASGINTRGQLAEQVRSAVDRRAMAAQNLLLLATPEDREREKVAIDQAQADIHEKLRQLKEASKSAPVHAREMVADIDQIEAAYGPVALAIVNAAWSNRRDEAIKLMNEQSRPLHAKLIAATDSFSAQSRQRQKELLVESTEQYERQRTLLSAISLAAVAFALSTGVFITRRLTRALGAEPASLSDLARRVAEGNISPINGAEFAPSGSVLASMDVMQKSLVSLIARVRAASDNIATGSSEIASGNQDLSSRTEQQASSLQETVASMDQITSSVKQNAENAQRASELATSAQEISHQGKEVVSNVVQTMTDINQSSTKVAEITGIIEAIAFQTNILALNAAVEAARAGEDGRGFAVVASEVRSLAQRSSSAAKEIKELIDSSVERIRDGSVLAEQAGHTMGEITQAIGRVSDIIGEIAVSSNEQSRGIEQVNGAIVQMDEVTQQNAALVEEAAAASKSLEDQGLQLIQAIAVFRVYGQS